VEAVGFSSCIINQAIFKLPSVREDVRQILSEINQPSALKNDKFNFFRNEEEQYENIMDLKHVSTLKNLTHMRLSQQWKVIFRCILLRCDQS